MGKGRGERDLRGRGPLPPPNFWAVQAQPTALLLRRLTGFPTLCPRPSLSARGSFGGQQRQLERAKAFFFRHFERIFVLLLVLAMAVIHALVDQKLAFLSFYYLPMILAGFYGGRRFAVMAGVFVVALVFYYQYFQGLDMLPGFYPDALLALAPWAGFLILTGYVRSEEHTS